VCDATIPPVAAKLGQLVVSAMSFLISFCNFASVISAGGA
jgi:hypothetical protein